MNVISQTSAPAHRIPLGLKLVMTAFVCVQVPFYWSAYGPTNFLYFCDVALFLALAATWTEKALPAGMATVGILLPQSYWVIDFASGLAGRPLTGMTDYMFQDSIPLLARAISLFHGWLPLLLLYLVYRLGYDRRSLAAWTVLAWGLMLVAYFLLPAPPAPLDNPNLPVNVNYVYGPSDARPQEWMPAPAWLALMMVALPVVFFIPTHLLLCKLFPSVLSAQPGKSSSGLTERALLLSASSATTERSIP